MDAILSLQDLLIPSSERNIRTIRTEDLDIYKSRLLRIIRQAYDQLDTHKQVYQAKYKQYYDKNKKKVEYQIGDKVRVHYPVPETEVLKYKVGVQWREPFEIVAKIDPATYRVRKEGDYSIKTMPIHVQRLKIYRE